MEALPTEAARRPLRRQAPVRALGIDGGCVRASNAPTPQEGWFEVIVGKSARDNGAGRCFGYVHRLEPSPAQRMQRFLSEEGLQPDHPVIFVSDGGDTVRHAQAGFGAHREYVYVVSARNAESSPLTGAAIRGNSRSKVYHLPLGSPGYDQISASNQVRFKSEAEAKVAGFRKAGNCNEGPGSCEIRNTLMSGCFRSLCW